MKETSGCILLISKLWKQIVSNITWPSIGNFSQRVFRSQETVQGREKLKQKAYLISFFFSRQSSTRKNFYISATFFLSSSNSSVKLPRQTGDTSWYLESWNLQQ